MNWVTKVRRGEGPVWGRLKAASKAVLAFHIPVNRLTRPVFRLLYAVHVGVREGFVWTRRFFWNDPLFRSQCESVGVGFRMEELPYIQGRGRIVIGDNVRFSGMPCFSFGGLGGPAPELIIGDGTFIGHVCGITIGASVQIGRHCLLATGVRVIDMDGHPLDAGRRRAGEPSPPEAVAPVVIEDDVWIGSEAFILKGVTVGARSVVAAASVVTKDVPPDTVVAGNPARVVKKLEPAESPERESVAAFSG